MKRHFEEAIRGGNSRRQFEVHLEPGQLFHLLLDIANAVLQLPLGLGLGLGLGIELELG